MNAFGVCNGHNVFVELAFPKKEAKQCWQAALERVRLLVVREVEADLNFNIYAVSSKRQVLLKKTPSATSNQQTNPNN